MADPLIDHSFWTITYILRQLIWRVHRRQFKCNTCGKPFSEDLDCIGGRRKHTDHFAEMIVKQMIHSVTHNVTKIMI